MNAVERLLAHGEQLLAMYDEMYRERIGDTRDPTLPAVPQESIYEIGKAAISAVPRGSSYWASPHWLQAAAEAAWLEAKAANVEPSSKQVIARTTEIFLERLSQREQLLSDATWRQLLADVVFESRAWEPLSAKVVALAEQVWQAAKEVSLLSESIEPKWWRHDRLAVFLKPPSSETTPAKRTRLRQALDLLHPYAQPPAACSTSEEQTNGNRSRAGRPQNDEALARDLLDGWRAYEPAEGRKTIDRYLAQRPDVRTLKTPDARQRKIASLRTALESAQSLRASKARQKRQARGKN
jgi:hypothetical protein